MIKQMPDNEIYLVIKYIKSVLWIEAKLLSYIEDARCIKVKLKGTLRCPFIGLSSRGIVRSVRKVSDRIFLCEHLMDYNLARLHEPTLNLSAHA